MVLGDLHGNARFVEQYVYPTATGLNADAIVQLGDFGLWEHFPDGVNFLDAVSACAQDTGIPMHALRGNHDKWSLALDMYGDKVTDEGFLQCRDSLYLIPDGLIWTWAGVRMRSFGGAYSVDKDYRLELERERWHVANIRDERAAAFASREPYGVPSTAGTLWFPEEELTDPQFDALLAADSDPVDIIFSHDKPRSSNPQWNRKDLAECWPNQDRLQRALLAHQPTYWFHGHLHHAYVDEVRSGDDSHTTVVGVSCDDEAAERFWRPKQSWGVLDLDDGHIVYRAGADFDDVYDRQDDDQ